MRNYCEHCDGGIITTHEPSDPPEVMTFTVCDECGGSGYVYDGPWSSFYIILLIPNFLLFV